MFSLVGGHWTVLQTVAWAQMIHDYSRTAGSLAAAVEQTFDGQHPCPLCRQIETAKSKERTSNPAALGASLDVKAKALLAGSEPLMQPRIRLARFPGALCPVAASRLDAPPTPPPRGGISAAV